MTPNGNSTSIQCTLHKQFKECRGRTIFYVPAATSMSIGALPFLKCQSQKFTSTICNRALSHVHTPRARNEIITAWHESEEGTHVATRAILLTEGPIDQRTRLLYTLDTGLMTRMVNDKTHVHRVIVELRTRDTNVVFWEQEVSFSRWEGTNRAILVEMLSYERF